MPIYLFTLGISLFVYFKIFQAMRQEVQVGREAMLWKKGLVVEDIAPEGKIQYNGEIWDAHAKGKRFFKGDHVRICGVRGLLLLVEEMSAKDLD